MCTHSQDNLPIRPEPLPISCLKHPAKKHSSSSLPCCLSARACSLHWRPQDAQALGQELQNAAKHCRKVMQPSPVSLDINVSYTLKARLPAALRSVCLHDARKKRSPRFCKRRSTSNKETKSCCDRGQLERTAANAEDCVGSASCCNRGPLERASPTACRPPKPSLQASPMRSTFKQACWHHPRRDAPAAHARSAKEGLVPVSRPSCCCFRRGDGNA